MSLSNEELGAKCREILEKSLPASTRLQRFELLGNELATKRTQRRPNPLVKKAAPKPKSVAADEGADAPAPVVKKVTKKKVVRKKTR